MGRGPSGADPRWDQQCKRHIPSYWTNSEPGVTTWWDAGCTNHQYTFPKGDLNIPDLDVYHRNNNAHPVPHRNFIASMIVPPHMTVTGWNAPCYNSNCVIWERNKYTGWRNVKRGGDFSGYTASATWGPGMYSHLSFPNMGVGARDIDSMQIKKRKSWPEFLRDCCQGIEPAGLCKNYAGPMTQACQPSMAHHCGLSLDWFKKPICKQWCSKNKSTCDGIAAKLCANSEDPYCSCFHTAENIIRPACFDPACSSGTAYQTAAHINQSTNCGVYCNQQFNIDKVGRDALLENNAFMQRCGTQAQEILDKEAEEEKKKQEAEDAKKKAEEDAKRAEEEAKKKAEEGGLGGLGGDGDNKTMTYAAVGGGGLSGVSSSFLCLLIIIGLIMYATA